MDFDQYCKESGYRGDLDGLLGRVCASDAFVASLPGHVMRTADAKAFGACLAGAGGPVITLGQIAAAWQKPLRDVARLAGMTEFMGRSL
jgi:hypothetical protein